MSWKSLAGTVHFSCGRDTRYLVMGLASHDACPSSTASAQLRCLTAVIDDIDTRSTKSSLGPVTSISEPTGTEPVVRQ